MGRRQKQVQTKTRVKDVYKGYKGRHLGGSILLRETKVVVYELTGLLLGNSLADKGDFWSWLSEPNSKWQSVSQYLGDGYGLSR